MINFKRVQNFSTVAVLLLVSLAAIGIIAKKLYFRVDITQDHVYTLSKGSLNIAAKFTEPVTAKFYFSKSLKEIPAGIKTYGGRIEEVLREYVNASKGKMRLEVIDPKPDTDDAEWAHNYGVKAIPLQSSGELYLGIVFIAGEKEEVIPYLDPRKEEFLEYDLSEALVKISSTSRPVLGIMSSLPINQPSMPPGYGGEESSEKWALAEGFENLYTVRNVDMGATSIPADIQTLLLVHPKEISEGAQYAIDQFVMRGGRLIVAVDPFSRIDYALSRRSDPMGRSMPQLSSNLPKLFAAWDVEFSTSEMVGDKDAATQISTGYDEVTYPFIMTLDEKNFSKESKITSHLRQIVFAEGGAFNLKSGSPYTWEPLITTGTSSGTSNAMMAAFQNPADLAGQFKADGKKRTIAGLLKGKFKSAFSTGAPAGIKDAPPQLKESTAENLIVLIGDVDFLHDSNAVDKIRFGGQVIMRPRNDNLNFVMNAVEFMGGNQDLISIRSSGKIARPFVRLQRIQQDAQARWKQEEERLSSELGSLQKNLTQLQSERTDGNRAMLSSAQQGEIRKFRDEEHKMRNRLREVRKNLREDIESLGYVLVALNLVVVPVLVCAFGVVVFYKREKRAKEERSHAK